jgi:exopolyphosphatase/guanosine-5'-triphosphate,3'-diphosphate pyrophosphatase
VGTNTLRRAKNAQDFLDAAHDALGHPIEVIAGQEEARLIYLGVAHTQADDRGRRLVVDIGGGSTEFIIGERFEASHRASLPLGCVSATQRFFAEGTITEAAMQAAEIAAHLELGTIKARYRRVGWEESLGASGTIKAVGAVIEQSGWGAAITPKGLQKLRKALIKAGSAAALELPGLSRERAPVLAGGLAVLSAGFEALGIERMQVSDGALREGLLYDLLGRVRHEDVRERTILSMASRYHVSLKFAERVARTARDCLGQVASAWGLEGEEVVNALRWSALLHEVGLAIAFNGYHKHGAYLVQHSDMPGFSRQNQQFLACLIRGHRRRFPAPEELCPTPDVPRDHAVYLCVLLRLAVLLNHGRGRDSLPDLRLEAQPGALEIVFPEDWLDAHPLARANLEREAEYLKAARIRLRYR